MTSRVLSQQPTTRRGALNTAIRRRGRWPIRPLTIPPGTSFHQRTGRPQTRQATATRTERSIHPTPAPPGRYHRHPAYHLLTYVLMPHRGHTRPRHAAERAGPAPGIVEQILRPPGLIQTAEHAGPRKEPASADRPVELQHVTLAILTLLRADLRAFQAELEHRRSYKADALPRIRKRPGGGWSERRDSNSRHPAWNRGSAAEAVVGRYEQVISSSARG
jgi:hypothetical protein